MMLSRSGPAVGPRMESTVRNSGGRQAAWKWCAGAPYRGTASAPPPRLANATLRMCVCACVCPTLLVVLRNFEGSSTTTHTHTRAYLCVTLLCVFAFYARK